MFRYFYIEKFLNQDTIDPNYLALVEADLRAIREAGCKAIIRFSYSAYGSTMNSPPYRSDALVDRVVGHIRQLAPVINRYASVVSSVQAGLVGIWGEWYYSDNFLSNPTQPWLLTDTDWENRGKVLDAFLDSLDSRIFLLVRYIGVHQRFASRWSAEKLARVGFHNDAFKASSDDWGTFITFSTQGEAVNKTYLEQITAKNVPMGGESANNNPPLSGWNSASADLARYHFNYLNPEYHQDVLASWGEAGRQTAEKKLGYRVRIESSDLTTRVTPGDPLNFTLKLINEGYAAPLANVGLWQDATGFNDLKQTVVVG